MAKRRSDKPRRPRRDGEITFGLEPSELSLEEILDEYRAQTTAEESAPTPEPEGEPLRLEAEEDGMASIDVSRFISRLDTCFNHNDMGGARECLQYWEAEARAAGEIWMQE